MSVYQRYSYGLVAIGSTAIAFGLTLLLNPLLTQSISIFFFVAIAITTSYAGLRWGIVTILASTLLINLFFIQSVGQLLSLSVSDIVRFASFSVVAGVIHGLCQDRKASQRQIEQLSQQRIEESAERLTMALAEAQTSKALLQQQVEHHRLVMEMSQRIRRSLNLHDILQTTVDEVRQFLQVDRVIIFQFAPGWSGRVTVESVGDETRAILPFKIYDPCVGDRYVESFRRGLVTAKADIYRAAISPCHVKFLAQFQVRANLVVPILKTNELWGLLAAHHCTDPREWQESEIDLLRQIASQVSIALQQADLVEQLQSELMERKQTEAALQESQVQLQRQLAEIEAIYQSAPIGLNVLDPDLRFVRINQRLADMNGIPIEAHIGRTIREVLPDLADTADQLLRPILATGEPLLNVEITGETPAQLGVQRTWLESFLPLKDGDRIIGISTVCEEITERKQAEAALQQSEARLRLAQTASNSAVWDWDVQRNTVIWLPEYYQLFQLDPAIEPSYENWLASIYPDDRNKTHQQTVQALQDQSSEFRIEFRVLCAGELRWFADIGQVLRNEAGVAIRVIGIVIDITQQKLIELALHQLNSELEQRVTDRTRELANLNDRLLTALMEQQHANQEKQLRWNITQAIRQSLDLNAILNTAVHEARYTLQVDRVAVYRFLPDWSGDFIAESVGSGWIRLVEPTVQKIWPDTYLQDTQGGRFRHHEPFVVTDIYAAGLQTCHIELLEQFQTRAYAVAPIFSGQTLWGLLAIYQNTVARQWQTWEVELLQQIASQLAIAIQQSELYSQLQQELQERQQTEAILREAERRWRSLLDNVQLLVVGLDLAGCITYINPWFLRLTGYTRPEVIGKPWVDAFVPTPQQQAIQSIFREVIRHNTHPHHHNPIVTKTGEERFIAWNNTQLQGVDGRIIGTISIGEDITDRQKVEQIKDEFIGIVSHELRTPLTAIQMSLGLLKTGVYAKKPDKAQRMIEIALIDTNRLVNLVNDILDLERLESGRTVLEKTVCQAMELMQQAVDGVLAIAIQQSITLTIMPTDAVVWAAADTIVQTLTNLLSNAIKFSPSHAMIQLRADRQTDEVLFQVQDYGRGIPVDKLETIFGRFQQVDVSDSREKGGTGLGLSICRSIIERHKGKIWVESTLGEGSTFFFTLPIPTNQSV